MSSKFALDLNGTITLRTDKVFRNGETKTTEHELAFDHVTLTFDNVDTMADAFSEAIGKTMASMMGEMPTLDLGDIEMPTPAGEWTTDGGRPRQNDGTPLDDEAVMHLTALDIALRLWGQHDEALGFEVRQELTDEIDRVLEEAGLSYMGRVNAEKARDNILAEGVVPTSARKVVKA